MGSRVWIPAFAGMTVGSLKVMPRTFGTAAKFSTAAPVFTALGDETRLRIVGRLCQEGPLSISRLTDGTKMSRQAVTKHLRVLSDAGLVRGERSGRERIWQIRARQFNEVRQYLSEISAQWDEALVRLQTLVEKEENQGYDSEKARRR